MKVISVVNQKGGTGKTTTTLNLGASLAKCGKKVLIIDLDAQGNLAFSVGIDEDESGIAKVIGGEASIKDIIIKKEDFYLVPANRDLADIEINLIQHKERTLVIKKILNEVKHFDFVLIDCAPSLSILTIAALVASDYVLIPMQFEVLSLQGLKMIVKTVDDIRLSLNNSIHIVGVLGVMFDRRKKLTGEIEDYIKDNFNINVFNSKIRLDVRISEAPSFGQSAVAYSPDSNGSRDYISFAKEFLQKISNI